MVSMQIYVETLITDCNEIDIIAQAMQQLISVDSHFTNKNDCYMYYFHRASARLV